MRDLQALRVDVVLPGGRLQRWRRWSDDSGLVVVAPEEPEEVGARSLQNIIHVFLYLLLLICNARLIGEESYSLSA